MIDTCRTGDGRSDGVEREMEVSRRVGLVSIGGGGGGVLLGGVGYALLC